MAVVVHVVLSLPERRLEDQGPPTRRGRVVRRGARPLRLLRRPTPRPSRRGRSRSVGAWPSGPRCRRFAVATLTPPRGRDNSSSRSSRARPSRSPSSSSWSRSTHWSTGPSHVGAPLIALSCLVPLGLAVGASNAASHADRVLVHLITTLGTVAIVAGAYLLAVRGFDKAPTTHADRDLLWWAMAAAAVAAVAQLALRGRFSRIATSFTYGAREAPDEVVRSFGTRMTRAIPMDELLSATRRVAAQDAVARVGRDLHRQRRGARPRRIGTGPSAALAARDA